MRYIHFYGNNAYWGTEYHEFQKFDDDFDDDNIDDISYDLSYGCAESYLDFITSEYGGFESEEERERYYEDAIGCYGWAELSKEEWENLKEMLYE